MSDTTSGLYAKLAAIQSKVQHVEKTGHVAFGTTSFDHFQEHGLFAIVKPLLEEQGLALLCGVDGWEKQGNHTILNFRLTLVDPETGEKHSESFPNEGVDSSDKGFNKAYTGAMKYALQKLFLIPTEKVDEQEGSDETHNQPSTRVEESSNGHITQAEARALLDRASQAGVNGEKLSLWLSSQGVEHEKIRNIGTGVVALRRLDTDGAEQLSDWLTGQESK